MVSGREEGVPVAWTTISSNKKYYNIIFNIKFEIHVKAILDFDYAMNLWRGNNSTNENWAVLYGNCSIINTKSLFDESNPTQRSSCLFLDKSMEVQLFVSMQYNM